jgi:hypothetical protein
MMFGMTFQDQRKAKGGVTRAGLVTSFEATKDGPVTTLVLLTALGYKVAIAITAALIIGALSVWQLSGIKKELEILSKNFELDTAQRAIQFVRDEMKIDKK